MLIVDIIQICKYMYIQFYVRTSISSEDINVQVINQPIVVIGVVICGGGERQLAARRKMRKK